MTKGFLKFDTTILQFEFGSIEEKFYIYLMRKENLSRFKTDHISGQVEITIRTVAKDIGVSENIVRRLIRQFQELNIIKLISKSNSKQNPSIYMLSIYQKHTVDNTVNNTVDNTVSTQLNVEKSMVLEGELHSCNTVNHTVNNTVNHASKIDNLINNKIDISNIVNSSQLELIKEKCSITGEITEQQQREIQNMKMKLLEEVIEKCNRHKSSYNINYLLTAYRNISPWAEIRSHKGIYSEEPHKNNNGKVISGAFQQRIDPPTNKKSMSERLGVENLNHYSKYDDLEDRLLKRQAEKRKNN